ncbi:hypothetical protein [Dactylosporangium darangshiense]|uniref:hypothetical protein n=1 Tax=Dactylosporangium darangshiense TaxID=579108 RepID=UPI00362B9C0A
MLAEKLRNALAVDLHALVRRYDAEQDSGASDTALTAAIAEAVAEARAWVRGGLGHGDRAAWLADIEGQYVHGDLEAKQDEYYRAKTEITHIFGRIDPSLDHAVQRLWDEVADLLRQRLTEELVPAGPRSLDGLRSTAEARRAHIIAGALGRLCELKEDYGSVVLRVTQPIIRLIHWESAPVAFAAAPPPQQPRPPQAAPGAATPPPAPRVPQAGAPAGSPTSRATAGACRSRSSPRPSPATRGSAAAPRGSTTSSAPSSTPASASWSWRCGPRPAS